MGLNWKLWRPVCLGAISVGTVAADQLTKVIMAHSIELGDRLAVIPHFFNLTHVRNSGIAFSLFADGGPMMKLALILVPSIVVLILLSVYLRTSDADVMPKLSIVLIIGGAISNLVDRVRLGYVVDFLDFYWRDTHFPSFNLADSFICLGLGLFCLSSFFASNHAKAKHV